MAILPGSLTQSASGTRLSVGRSLTLLAALLATLAFILTGDQVERFGAYGYPAVFLISLLSNAALLLPAPRIALVVAAGSTLDPLMVGVVAGQGLNWGR